MHAFFPFFSFPYGLHPVMSSLQYNTHTDFVAAAAAASSSVAAVEILPGEIGRQPEQNQNDCALSVAYNQI